MSAEHGTRCHDCGAFAVHPVARAGRTHKYREFVTLPIPVDFAVPTCSRCGKTHFDAATMAVLLPLLESEYRRLLRRRIRQLLERLNDHISQRRLESLLGLSQGYLSRLRSGSGMPSTELVGHLALLANDPAGRLRELEQFWSQPPEKDEREDDVDPVR